MEETELKKGFYLIDAESEKYFVGRVFRTDSQMIEPCRHLEVGETYWIDGIKGFERFQ